MNNYQKPNILFQPLSLSENITESCTNGFNYADSQSCAIKVPGEDVTIFSTNATCIIYDPEMIDSICYHVPVSSGMSVFMS
jgi:hypothetical protein